MLAVSLPIDETVRVIGCEFIRAKSPMKIFVNRVLPFGLVLASILSLSCGKVNADKHEESSDSVPVRKRFTEVTDPEILAQLNAPKEVQYEDVTDPELIAQLNALAAAHKKTAPLQATPVAAAPTPKEVQYEDVTDPEILAQLNAPAPATPKSEDRPDLDALLGIAPKREARPDLDAAFGITPKRKARPDLDALFDEVERIDAAEKAAVRRARLHQILYNTSVLIVFAILGAFVWRKRRSLTLPKLKAVYVVWIFIHIMFLVFSPYPLGGRYSRDPYRSFYPLISAESYRGLESGIFFNKTDQYDITEFLFYTLFPLVAYYAVKLWLSGENSDVVGNRPSRR